MKPQTDTVEKGLMVGLIVLSMALLVSFSCNKKFDAPPVYTGPGLQPNFTIRDLRRLHFTGSFEQVQQDFVIECIVIADDRQDNFYKSIVVQDSTGGVIIRMDATGLYTDYPVGARVAVQLNQLWLGDYGGMLQIGAGIDRSDPVFLELSAIPMPLFSRFLVRKSLNNPVEPRIVRIDQLTDSLQGCLVRIENAEFSVSDTGRTYADAVNKTAANRTVKSCAGGSLYVRTAGFANFAQIKTPRGNGSITGVYSVFKTEKQLLVRDTADVQMKGLRCTGAGVKVLLDEDFEGLKTDADIHITGWKNTGETGGRLFQSRFSLNNGYAEVGAFATGQPLVLSWLISPPINLSNTANEILSFRTKDGFDNGGVLQAYISTNYDGAGIPSKARWTLLKANISKGSVAGFANDWALSGNISLSGYTGIVYLAFRYDGADPVPATDKRTTRFQLDNVKVQAN